MLDLGGAQGGGRSECIPDRYNKIADNSRALSLLKYACNIRSRRQQIVAIDERKTTLIVIHINPPSIPEQTLY